MADQTKTLAWRLIVETQGVEKNTRKAADSLARMEGAAGKLGAALKGAGVAALAFAAAKLALEALKIADAYTAMANTLKQSTDNAAELQAVQLALIEQAHETQSTVEQATASFNKLHDATEGLGLSQQQVIDLSKTLSDVMRLSGMNAEQAQEGIAQFGNVLEDGAMSLKEFKQAFKESPELIKALQAGLGKTKDELRLMAEQGDLLTKVLLDGLGKASEEVAKRAAQQTPTLMDAFKSAASGFGAMIGEFNEGIGITEGLAVKLQAMGKFLSDLAQKANLMGIAVGFAIDTFMVEVNTFIDQTIANVNALGIAIIRSAEFVLTLGNRFGDVTEKWEKQSDDSIRNILANRRKMLDEIQRDADARVGKLLGGDLNKPGTIVDVGQTDDQIKALESFASALDAFKKKTRESATELEALRIEMNQGKEAADAFRAQVSASLAGDAFIKQMTELLKKTKMTISDKDLAIIKSAVAEQAKSQAELKATADAWNILNAAMSGAMTESERAEKETLDLVKAFEKLKATMKATPEQLAQLERAKAAITERGSAAETSLAQAMTDLSGQSKAAQNEMRALSKEIFEGVEAANAFRAEIEGMDAEAAFWRQFAKVFADAGKIIPPEAVERVKAYFSEITKGKLAAMSTAEALDVFNEAVRGGMSETEIATKQINELNRAMIELDKAGLLTDSMIAQFDEAFKRIADGVSTVKAALQDMGRSLVDNLVDFLADGEFNFKRFAQSLIKDIGRIVIQLMIVKALQNTTFGNFIGIAKGEKGLALNHGRLLPMANGGIVTGPTVFPMANGGAGLMGEAGPEAVMPLARLSSGKLGVNANPSNIQVINNTGVQARARIERSENRTSIILEAAQLGAQLAEDRMTRSMRSGYGATSQALQGTYALRRRA